MGTIDRFDWRSAYRDVSWAYVRSQAELDRLAQYIRTHFPHVTVPIDNRKLLIDTVIVLLSGLHEPSHQWLHEEGPDGEEGPYEDSIRSDRGLSERVPGVSGAATATVDQAPATQAVP